jgi:Aspartyl protease
MKTFKWFASFVLAATIVSTLSAETHCPGNVASVPFRFVNRHQMLVAVSVNHSGPYNFLLDTGSQITMVDPSLAASLHLATQGTATVVSVGIHGSASFAQLDLLETGSHSVANQKVLVYDLKNLQANGLDIQGVLGEDFLQHFDMLIDNAHKLLCLDEAGTVRTEVKGTRVALVIPASTTDDATLSKPLIVMTRLSDSRRPIRLKLDSGTNVSFLYNTDEYMALGLFRGASLHGGAIGSQRTFMALPPQNVRIGSVEIQKVPFITLAGAQKDSRTSNFDGLLTMEFFRQIFIDHADHFAVLQPW